MVDFGQLQLTDGVPIYLQIIGHLKAGISAGVVKDGDELPSRRTLSALLGVNPNTPKALSVFPMSRRRTSSSSCPGRRAGSMWPI